MKLKFKSKIFKKKPSKEISLAQTLFTKGIEIDLL
jgi:hypothetical protein